MRKLISSLLVIFLFMLYTTTAEAARFKDVPTNHFAYEAIHSMSERGIISGYSDGTFKRDEPVTRAQAAKIVALSLNLQPSTKRLQFRDVSSTHWAYPYIQALVENGVVSDGAQFHPNRPLTRGEMAQILTIGYSLQSTSGTSKTFRDISKQSPLYRSVIAISDAKITLVANGSAFRPNDSVKRAEMAAFVYRAEQFASSNPSNEKNDAVSPQEPVVKTPALETVDLINQYRKQRGLQNLKHDEALSKIALAKARDMADKQYFDHTSPTYGSVGKMLDYFNYDWMSYGENIAMGYGGDAQRVSKAWYDSPSHYQNIMNQRFTNIGSAVYVDAKGTPYWVHIFTSKK